MRRVGAPAPGWAASGRRRPGSAVSVVTVRRHDGAVASPPLPTIAVAPAWRIAVRSASATFPFVRRRRA